MRVQGAGVELAVAQAGDPARPTVVLLHGYPDAKEVWDLVAPDLALRHHVVRYDVRGAGASGLPTGDDPWSFERLEDDLLAVLDATAPGKRVHLVGHDWGGIQGWRFATTPRVADRLASFTCLSGPYLEAVAAWRREASWPAAARQALRSWYVGAMRLPGAVGLSRAVGPLWPWLVRRHGHDAPGLTVARDGTTGIALYRRHARALSSREAPAEPLVPVQLVVSHDDPSLGPGLFEPAARACPRLRRVDVTGGHWLQRSRPSLVVRLVADLVRDVQAGAFVHAPAPRRLGPRHGERCLVTGAGSGIGRAVALALAAEGADLLLVDLDPASAARTADDALAAGACAARAERCDVSDRSGMEALAARVHAEDGPLDVLVNNAGIAVAGPFLDTTPEEWARLLDVNLWGVVHGCRLFGRAMAARGRGAIVNVASAAGFTPTRTLPAYCTTKAAVLMLSECLRGELGPRGVRVTALCPGFVSTNIVGAARFVGADDAGQALLRESTGRLLTRRAYPPERVAKAVLKALRGDPGVVVVTPEGHLLRLASRIAPRFLRDAIARLEAPS